MSTPFMIRSHPPRPIALALLEAEGLPVSDLADGTFEHFFFAGSDGSPIGLVGLEIHGVDALLRSLVVCESERRKGLGAALVQHAEDYSMSKGVKAIYLLTTTAETFFSGLGYRPIDRTKAPPSIQVTREFASLCPASSTFMAKSLYPDGLSSDSLWRRTGGGQMTPGRTYNVLFLCTGNSARSIIAEALLNQMGAGRFHAYSAGSHPKGEVHPLALELLKRMGLPTKELRSKSWDEFAEPSAAMLDFIFTVCDNAAGEMCPIWPGKPITAHWGIADPAAAEGTEAERALAFRTALRELEARIRSFISLPIRALDHLALKEKLKEIGQTRAES
jgi:arsenate reductase (thioredoxin)